VYCLCNVLSNNNHNFHNFVHLIYPDELEIKDTTESYKSASFLNILHNSNSRCRLTTSLYDKLDDFDFAIVNFPFRCSNIPLSPAYDVYISQLIQYARESFTYEDFSKRGKLLTKSWCCKVTMNLVSSHHFVNKWISVHYYYYKLLNFIYRQLISEFWKPVFKMGG
jgi:hypothetical protein